MRNSSRLFLAVLTLLLFSASGIFAAVNLVKNPSFEDGTGAMPTEWQSGAYIEKPGVTDFKWESNNAHSGKKYVTITNNSENDARFKQDVPVKENAFYKLSCWTKTKNVGAQNKGANISIEGKLETSPDIKGTNGKWESTELYAKTGQGVTLIRVMVGIGSYGSMNTGKASFDDVAVEEVSAIPDGAVVATIGAEMQEPSAAGNPVTPSRGTAKTFWFLAAGAVIIIIAGAFFYKLRIAGAKGTGDSHTGPGKKDDLI